MDNSNVSTRQARLPLGISVCAAVLFAGLYFFNPRTVFKTEAQTLTSTKAVEKIVKLSVNTAPEHLYAKAIHDQMKNATFITAGQMLFNMTDVKVNITVDDSIKTVISENAVRAKYELALRRNNVPINPQSEHVVAFNVQGLILADNLISYAILQSVTEDNYIWRKGECHITPVRVWEKGGSFGTVGKVKAEEVLLQQIEKSAEIFANDFLSANAKK
ncbi:MAG: hypothetical protein JWR69_3998 [Pedosphaera sp.]|nr:hypothetical protein [Pedosphaera sp.]